MALTFRICPAHVLGFNETTSLAHIDNERVVYHGGSGHVIVHNVQTGKQDIVLLSDDNNNGIEYGADEYCTKKIVVDQASKHFFLLQKNTDCEYRVAVVDGDNVNDWNSFRLNSKTRIGANNRDYDTLLRYNICATTLSSPIIVILEKRDGNSSPILSIREINGDILVERSVAELNSTLLENVTMSFQPLRLNEGDNNGGSSADSDNDTVLTIQTRSTLLFFQIKQDRDSWEVVLANYPPSKLSLKISGDIMHHCTIQGMQCEWKEITILASSCRTLIGTESGLATYHHEEKYDVQCLEGLHDGFVIASSDANYHIFQMTRGSEGGVASASFHQLRTIQKPETLDPMGDGKRMLSLSCSPKGNYFCALESKSNQLLRIALDTNTNCDMFQVVSSSHCGAISSADVCLQVSMLVTAGLDGTIRLTNYKSGRLILCKKFGFSDIPTNLTFHPSGQYLVISFADEVLCVRILVDDMRVIRRMPLKHCRICTFSSCGSFFSVARDNLIHIFEFLSGDKIRDLVGHNSRVASLLWTKGDECIISCDNGGMIYRFDVSTGDRIKECALYKSNKDVRYALLDKLWIYSSDKIDILCAETLCLEKPKVLEGRATHLLSSRNSSFCVMTLECGGDNKTHHSAVSLFCALTQNNVTFDTRGKIVAITLSPNDEVLIVCFDTGSIVFFDVTILRNGGSLLTEEPQVTLSYDTKDDARDVTFISDIGLQEKKTLISGLKTLTQEVSATHDYRIGIMKMANDESVKKLEEDIQELRNEGKEQLEAIIVETSAVSRCHNTLSLHQCQLLQNANEEIIRSRSEYAHKIASKHRIIRQDWENRINGLERIHQSNTAKYTEKIESMKKELEKELEESRRHVRQLEEEEWNQVKQNNEIIHQMEEEVDTYFERVSSKNKKIQEGIEEEVKKATSENVINSKRSIVAKDRIEELIISSKTLLARDRDLQRCELLLNQTLYRLNETKSKNAVQLKKLSATHENLERQKKKLQQFAHILKAKIDEMNKYLPETNLVKIRELKKQKVKLLEDLSTEISIKRNSLSKTLGIALNNELHEVREAQSKLAYKEKFLLKQLQDFLDKIQSPEELQDLTKKRCALFRSFEERASHSFQRDISVKEETTLKHKISTCQKDLRSNREMHNHEIVQLRGENIAILDDIKKKSIELSSTRIHVNKLKDQL